MILATAPAFEPLEAVATLPPPSGAVGDAGRVARDYVNRVRAELCERHVAGAGGVAVVAAYTDAIDRLVALLFEDATLHFQSRHPFVSQRCTIVAQGGYGRGELNPYSDIDLLVLYPWKVNPYVETVTELVLYSLWDAGLQVGHAMRNVRECVRLAERDMKVKTALLDARWLSGDLRLWRDFEARSLEDVWGGDHTAFFREKLAENLERHGRSGDSVYLLQPHLKEGQGGLRDLHTAMWMAKVKFKVRTMRELIAVGVLGEREVADLDDAVDFVWRVRNGMHFMAASHQDLLGFEQQERLAPVLGFGEGRSGTEALMRTYFRHATTIFRVSEEVIDRCTRPNEPYRRALPVRVIGEGLRIQGHTLGVAGRDVLAQRPQTIVEVFAETQRHEVSMAPGTCELIREFLPALAAVRADPAVGQAFLRILRPRGPVADTLFAMHRLGVLKTIIPEWEHLECLIAHDPFHIYTVDHHSLMGVREIDRLRAGEFAEQVPLLTEVVRDLPQPELLVLGMLFHDIGKGQGDDHSGRGARMARAIGARIGLNEDEIAATEFLVQHHLLMSHLAQRRDVHDDQLVIDFCRTVGTLENLQRLYVLTYADMRAVAPGVWNNWRGTLVTELYRRGHDFFERGVFAAEDRAARAARVRARVVGTAPARERAALAGFVESMPDGYVLSTPEELIAGHGELRGRLAAAEAAGERPAVAVELVPYPDRDFTEVSICTRDRPGLFAKLSGVFAAHGLNILGARINTSRDGVALDAFRVSHPSGEAGVEPERWERVERTLRNVLADTVDVEELVRRTMRPSILQRKRRPVPTRVEIDNAVSSECTVLDVYAADRVGLLFTITNCLYHCWLEIHLAKITTMVDEVLDVFYVTDHEGRKVEDPARLEQIRAALEQALAPDAAPPASGVRAASA